MPRVRKVKKSNSKNHMVWRIAVYIRLSKDDGNDESLSVTNQKKIIREYLENFFEEEYILVDIISTTVSAVQLMTQELNLSA